MRLKYVFSKSRLRYTKLYSLTSAVEAIDINAFKLKAISNSLSGNIKRVKYVLVVHQMLWTT